MSSVLESTRAGSGSEPAAPVFSNGRNESTRSRWDQQYETLLATAKIAVVDDEELNIEIVQGHLRHEGYQNFFRSTDSTQALELFRRVQPDVVLMDVVMPGMTGLEVLAAMREDESMVHIPVIVLTADDGADTKMHALRLGPSDVLYKPVDATEMLLRVRNVLTVKAYQDHLAGHSQELERMVRERTADLAASRRRIIHCLARAAEFRDDDTGHHVTRVGKYAAVIADELGYDRNAVELIEQAAKLHDIGKIGVPDSVLLKRAKLEEDEFALIKRHCSIGNSIINPVQPGEVDAYRQHTEIGATLLDVEGYPILELAATIAQTHHEKWDGSGYPMGLKGEDIPIEGRITAVADVFDALSSERPYKAAFPREKCFRILEEGRGSHFDPEVLDAFFRRTDEITSIQLRYAES
ncbi:MAG: HD domain-containing phosphohydrolase [Planctomycetota bacterium]